MKTSIESFMKTPARPLVSLGGTLRRSTKGARREKKPPEGEKRITIRKMIRTLRTYLAGWLTVTGGLIQMTNIRKQEKRGGEAKTKRYGQTNLCDGLIIPSYL